jgi:hypothetical protein
MSTNTTPASWYAITEEGHFALRCAECHASVDLEGPALDHHPGICPHCGVECVYLSWKGRIVQIVLQKAPPAIVQVIRFAQQHFDELEYVELVAALEQLMDSLYSPCVTGHDR